MKVAKESEDPALDVNLTPLIDVTFLLLVFFTMISVFNEMEREAEVVLPEAYATVIDEMAKERMIVNIEVDGQIVVFSQRMNAAKFRKILRGRRKLLAYYEKETGAAPIVVRGDLECPYEHIKEVLDVIRDEKFQKILFASHEIKDKE